MTTRLVVRGTAEADITGAALWYEQRSPGLSAVFLRAVDVTLAEIPRVRCSSVTLPLSPGP